VIKILLVEDDREKAMLISAAIVSVDKAKPDFIDHCSSAVEAKRALQRSHYDLLILDINIPVRTDKPVRVGEGVDVLNTAIAGGDKYNIPTYVICLSAHADGLSQAHAHLANPLWKVMRFAYDETDWRDSVQAAVSQIMAAKRPPFPTDGQTYHSDLGIVVGLEDIELQSILDLEPTFSQIHVRHDPTRYFRGYFSKGDKRIDVIVAAAPRMGLSTSAVISTKLIETFRPRYLAMSGICAGVRAKTALGDILVADPCWEWGSGKLKADDEGERFLGAPYQWRLDATLRSCAKDIGSDRNWIDQLYSSWQEPRPTNKPKILIDAIASGASVLQRKAAMDAIINQHKNLIGVEMEIFAMLTAAENASSPRPTTIAVKSVCDFGDETKTDDVQRYAAFTSAHFLRELALRSMAEREGD
jgi:nucleoside phosphorylase/CheY-like chemotaxis protein